MLIYYYDVLLRMYSVWMSLILTSRQNISVSLLYSLLLEVQNYSGWAIDKKAMKKKHNVNIIMRKNCVKSVFSLNVSIIFNLIFAKMYTPIRQLLNS